MQGRRLVAQDQFVACCFPSWPSSSAVKVAIVPSRIVDPHPGFPSVDLKADKTLAQVQFIQVQREGACVKRRVIGSRWDAWLPLLLTGTLPFQECGEIAACFGDHILNDRAAIASREIGKCLAEVPIRERIWMRSSFYRVKFGPGEQIIGGNHSLAYFASLLGNHLDSLGEFVGVCQKKIQIEAAGPTAELHPLGPAVTFVWISSPRASSLEIKNGVAMFGGW